VGAVAGALRVSLAEGRAAVARIVGRDPETLDQAGVARAAIESAAENFSDAVVAPAFWFLIGGLPGIAIYKAVNTADSMIGHRSARFVEFGWAAARLDDLLNWLPARLAGALICLAGGGRAALAVMWRDAGLHKSPNAGWPEAATAASLEIALAGPRVYGGALTGDPYLNAGGRKAAGPADIEAAVQLIWRAWWGVLAVATVAALLV
jgi:adenosylcobinamide-phosphate synthase